MKKILFLFTFISMLTFNSCSAPDKVDYDTVFTLYYISPDNNIIVNLDEEVDITVKVQKYENIKGVTVEFNNGDSISEIKQYSAYEPNLSLYTYKYKYKATKSGIKEISITAKEASSGQNSNVVKTKIMVNTKPVASLTLTDSIYVFNETKYATATLQAKDLEDGILSGAAVEFKVDGKQKTPNLPGTDVGLKIDLQEYSLGCHTIEYKVTDKDGAFVKGRKKFYKNLYTRNEQLADNFTKLPTFTKDIPYWKVKNFNPTPNKRVLLFDEKEVFSPNGYLLNDPIHVSSSFFIMNPDKTVNENGKPHPIPTQGHNDNKYLFCLVEDIDVNGNPLPNNDWVYTPLIKIEKGDSFEFWARGADEFFKEKLKVYAITSGSIIQDTKNPLHTGDHIICSTSEWKEYKFDISKFAGKEIRLAINYCSIFNANQGDALALFLDDIKVVNSRGKIKLSNDFSKPLYNDSHNKN